MNKKSVFTIILCIVMLFTCIASYAYELPQKYSTEEFVPLQEFEEEMSKVEIPEYVERTYTDVWVNDKEIILPTEPVKKGDQIYIPAKTFFESIGMKVTVKNGKMSLEGQEDNAGFTAQLQVNKKKIQVNGDYMELYKAPRNLKGYLMVNTEVIAKMLNAKVWYDEDGNSLVISTGKYKDDEKLRIIAGKFYMNGEPYYEISFNKWDLYMQIEAQYVYNHEWPTADKQKEAAEDALKILHENGFKTIRFFCNHNYTGEKYYAVMDEVLDLCDKYDIKVVPTLQLPSGEFVVEGESFWDLMCNPESASRQKLYDRLDEFITRYKDRKTILMWEMTNEGNLSCDVGYQTKTVCLSIRQMGNFFADCAERIKALDPDRPITTGDGELRDAQYHLYYGIREGYSNNWTQDTLEQRLIAYQLLNHGMDVISVHAYNYGDSDVQYRTSEQDETLVPKTIALYMQEAKRLGKPLYDGETGLGIIYQEYNDETFARAELEEYLQESIDAGVQLTHWWTFHTDRVGHESEDTYAWNMDFGQGLEVMAEYNRKIQEKYCQNGIKEYTVAKWQEADVPYEPVISAISGENPEFLESANYTYLVVSIIACIIVLAAITVIVLILTKKRKHG